MRSTASRYDVIADGWTISPRAISSATPVTWPRIRWCLPPSVVRGLHHDLKPHEKPRTHTLSQLPLPVPRGAAAGTVATAPRSACWGGGRRAARYKHRGAKEILGLGAAWPAVVLYDARSCAQRDQIAWTRPTRCPARTQPPRPVLHEARATALNARRAVPTSPSGCNVAIRGVLSTGRHHPRLLADLGADQPHGGAALAAATKRWPTSCCGWAARPATDRVTPGTALAAGDFDDIAGPLPCTPTGTGVRGAGKSSASSARRGGASVLLRRARDANRAQCARLPAGARPQRLRGGWNLADEAPIPIFSTSVGVRFRLRRQARPAWCAPSARRRLAARARAVVGDAVHALAMVGRGADDGGRAQRDQRAGDLERMRTDCGQLE